MPNERGRKGFIRLTEEEAVSAEALLDSVDGNVGEAIDLHSELLHSKLLHGEIDMYVGVYEELNGVSVSSLAEHFLVGSVRFHRGDIGVTKLGAYVNNPDDIQMYHEKKLLKGYYPKRSYVKLR